MAANSLSILISFGIYLIGMLIIGLIFYKRTENLSDYVLGGRGLNSWVTALSSQASDMSGWLLMGLPGYAYLAGFESIWIAIGLAVGTYVNWKLIAKRLRQYTKVAGDSITLSVYFENRFRDKSKILRTVSAIFILIFFILYTSSGLVAGGKLFNTVFGMPYIIALTVGTIVVISYTFLGGFMAVSWTDFFQGMLMFFAILAVPIAGTFKIGGISAIFDTINNLNTEFLNPFTTADGNIIKIIPVISLLAWGLGYFGQPHILARFMAISSPKKIKEARKIAMVWVVISLCAAVFVGIVGRVYLSQTLKGPDSETVFMLMVNSIFPSAFAGIFLAAILAAIMSTADSQLLVAASAFTEDIYKALIKKDASEKELVWVSRLTVIFIAAISYVLALNPDSSVLDLVAYAWAGFGAAFGPVVIFSLFWKRMTIKGAAAGMIVGGVTVLIWKHLQGGIFDLYEIVPGFILGIIAIIIFSLMDKEPSKEILDEFDSVSKNEL
ncbi:sodium/proline symporter PutP [Tepidibacter formicigenes]|jgi:sodium/proline symporter|uniref:Sodium/proline symporter n=1 Tax=Tepidibacter formicigenes DSM 15518 TaxID=1123349 RepID=A0A1M6M8M5_9FIRM|nr:sodium/proline symporter PutP [Tepidibacter formicigenes]SHJ79808.1 sodium/proline symporter [Tepidibacter formicigenes DSM 15518]